MSDLAPPRELSDLVAHVLARLSAATADVTAAWRTPMLASLSASGTPTLRTVVLRAVEPERRSLRINTDRFSEKAAQIAGNPSVELGFWDPVAGQQLRVAGRAAISHAGPAVDAVWSRLAPAAQAVYRHGPPPGTPTPGTAPQDHPPTDPAGGNRDAFAVITVTWHSWDWVWLGRDVHRRAKLRWHGDGRHEAEWTVP